MAAFLVLLLPCNPASAQILQAKWVDESEERIDEIRKVPVRILVLDRAGDHVADAPVRIEQLRHAFPFGLRITAKSLEAAPDKNAFHKTPVWRCFNAVALDALSQWPRTQPAKDRWDFEAVDQAIQWSQDRSMLVRWGGVVSADPGRMPQWAGGLKGDALRLAVEGHTRQVVQRFNRSVEQFDLIAHAMDHDDLQRELGVAGIRRLHQLAEADALHKPQGRSRSQVCLKFEDCFFGERLSRTVQRVINGRESFIPADAVAAEMRLRGSIVEAPVTRSVKAMCDTGLPVVVTGLEVAGPSPAAAAINLETALRSIFSQPGVAGIYINGLRGDELNDHEAALMDEKGQPNEAGDLFDAMIRKHWWSDSTIKADELGNVRHRVFAGAYRISARLPDGSTIEVETLLPAGSKEKLIVLQAVGAAPATVDAEKP